MIWIIGKIKQTLKIDNFRQSLKYNNKVESLIKQMNREKKLRLIISSMKEKELIQFFQFFLNQTHSHFHKTIKQISYSCYESTCQIDHYIVNGYGKTQTDSLLSGINNLIDCLIEDEKHCHAIKQAIKKANLNNYHFLNNIPSNNTNSKKLLSTQKTVKTLASQTPVSVQKKVLTMSANISSKHSSSKSKSIKQEIFQYFNLQNLKVKNPSSNQQFNSISPMAGNKKTFDQAWAQKEKRSITINDKLNNQNVKNQETNQLQIVYRKIREVKEQISLKEKQNLKLKQQIHSKKIKHHISTQANQDKQPNNSQYFTRQSLEPKPNRKPSQPVGTQSTKKLSYLEMSLNDKLLTKSSQLQSVILGEMKEKQNQVKGLKPDRMCMSKDQGYNNAEKEYKLVGNKGNMESFEKVKEGYENKESDFENVEIKGNIQRINSSEYTHGSYQQQKPTYQNMSNKMTFNGNTNNNTKPVNDQPQRKCLIDISNVSHNNLPNQNQKIQNIKTNHYPISGNLTPGGTKAQFYHFHTFKENSLPTKQNSNSQMKQNTFHTAKQPTQQPARHPLLYPKVSEQSSIQSTKKLRSYSVQNHLPDKITAIKSNNTTLMNNNGANSSMINSTNLNGSFDNGMVPHSQNKKIKIPKLNLQILPNYHGRSNKSLNQSLMDNYSKNKQTINQ